MDQDTRTGRLTHIAIAGAIGLAALAVIVLASVWLASEATLMRRYPLASTAVHPQMTQKEIARGAHLMAIAGCADCHGADLEGRLLDADTPLPVYSDNLLRATQVHSDGEIERAIRYGIKPDATTEWAMPSASYKYMSEDDLASIISYLRMRPVSGPMRPAPQFDFPARLALVRGEIEPEFLTTFDSASSLDPGPRYDGGRYLVRIACAECHGTDLRGKGYAPDLSAIARYDRSAFFALMHGGAGAGGRFLPVMHRLAEVRFHAFADYEIMALYDYLYARAHAPAELVSKDAALRRHEEDLKALRASDQQ